MQHKTYKAAIFDMDGTVLNTLEDLTSALNYVLAETGHTHAYGTAQVRQFFGSGVQVALTRVLAIEKGIASYDQLEYVGQDGDAITPRVDAQEVSRIQDIFRPYYAAHCAIQTGEYAGISQLLGHLRAAGIQTAVVSNKPDLAVQKLTADYFQGLFDLALGEQPQIRRKPARHGPQSLKRLRTHTGTGCLYRRFRNRHRDRKKRRLGLPQRHLGFPFQNILTKPRRLRPRRYAGRNC